MTDVLLKELSNSDINWILATGCPVELEAETVLVQPGQSLEAVYILLDGVLTVSLSEWEMARLSSGEIVAAIPGLETYLPSTTVRSQTKSLLLAIPRSQLVDQLQHDLNFAAHLYRTSAVLLSNRLEQLLQHLEGSTAAFSHLHIREAITVFAELQDSDLDWLIAVGQVQQLVAGTMLVQDGRPIDALHILLDGAIALSASDDQRSRLAKAFNVEHDSHPEHEFARLSRGDLIGEMLFVDACPAAIAVKALRDSQVLSIPRWRLAAKLLHDVGFAARFYRVLAVLLANKQHAIAQHIWGGKLFHSNDFNSNDLNSQLLTRAALAEARFEWMLKRTSLRQVVGR